MATGNIGTGNTLTLATFTTMKRLALLPLLALAAAPCFAQDPATNAPALVTKLYPVRPSGAGCTLAEPVDPTEETWKAFFAGFDVEWPEGSSFREFPQIGRWAVRNTEENHARIAAILRGCDLVPFQVRTQFRFYSVAPAAFEALDLPDLLGTTLGPDSWKALCRRLAENPGAELVGCPTVLAQTGSMATVKADVEYIFPTEYDVTMLESAATASDTNAPAQFVAAAVEPQLFQTREVGQIVQVTPRVSSDGSRISLDLTPSLVLPPVWRNFGSPVLDGAADPTEPRMDQPFFPVFCVATSIDLMPGDTVAFGGGTLDEPGRGRRFHVLFVTASFVEMEPDIVSLDNPTP